MKKRQPKTKRLCAKCGKREPYLNIATLDWCEPCLFAYIKPDQVPVITRSVEEDFIHPGYVHPDKLIDQTLLLLGTRPFDHPFFRVAVDARLGEKLIHFGAGCVVEQQLCEPPITFPIWAKLVWAKGARHSYYKLIFAEANGTAAVLAYDNNAAATTKEN
jgi:hypothetical protein